MKQKFIDLLKRVEDKSETSPSIEFNSDLTGMTCFGNGCTYFDTEEELEQILNDYLKD